MLTLLSTIAISVGALFTPTQVSFVRADTLPNIIVVKAPIPIPEAPPEAVKAPVDDVACNCWRFLATKLPVPRMADIQPNTTPHVGAIAIFSYKDKTTGEKVKHIAYIEELTADGFVISESNFEKCKYGRRTVAWTDQRLVGFFDV